MHEERTMTDTAPPKRGSATRSQPPWSASTDRNRRRSARIEKEGVGS